MTEELRAAVEAMMGSNWIALPEVVSQQAATVEARRLVLKVGTLEIDLREDCTGTVLLDGKRLPVQAMTVQILVGSPPRVTAVFTPVAADDTLHPPEEYRPEYIVPCPRPTP